ncbi:MAG: DUF1273 domain-containing protein [Oscillospiraceae bacterium]|jgi:uncharacterized phage-like protein YoqJ|nr:DUF1273 domain-containing protein [Oscillospiraceae bacterium]
MQEPFIACSCAFTGHRPPRFPFGADETDERCLKLKAVLSEQIAALVAGGVTDFYTGMALGVDQWAGLAVLGIKKERPAVRLTAVVPCKTQADGWSVGQRKRYLDMLAVCDGVVTLAEEYTRFCMFERNRYLVDHAAFLLAVYDGGGKGGTAYTVGYARRKRRRITIIHPDTPAVTPIFWEGGGLNEIC